MLEVRRVCSHNKDQILKFGMSGRKDGCNIVRHENGEERREVLSFKSMMTPLALHDKAYITFSKFEHCSCT